MKKRFFQKHHGQFKMSARDKVGEILIYDVIGDDYYGGVGSKDFVQQLAALGEVDSITVRINSPGGDVFEGIAIYNALKMHPATINVQIDSLAASIATVIAMAGDTITISDSGMMMVHNASGLCWGEATDMREMADLLDKIRAGSMLGAYARTKMSVEELTAIMDAETWYTAQEAVAAGWADSIATAPAKSASAKAKYDLSAFRHPPAALVTASTCTCPCAPCVDGDCPGCIDVGCACEGCADCGQMSASLEKDLEAKKAEDALIAQKTAEKERLVDENARKPKISSEMREEYLRLAAIG